MRFILSLSFLLFALTLCLSSAAAAGSGSAPFDIIAAAESKWQNLYAQNRLPELVAMYAPDAIMMPSGSPAVNGSQSILELFQGFWSQGVRQIQVETIEVQPLLGEPNNGISGLYFERGIFVMWDASKVLQRGKYLDVWYINDMNDAYIYRSMENSDAPEDGATPIKRFVRSGNELIENQK